MSKILYFINYLFAILLLVGYALPYISPEYAASISVLSLTVPVLIVVNTLFVLYWGITLNKKILLSLVCLTIGYFASTPLYIFSKNKNTASDTFTIMNYNVKLYNLYDWIDDKEIPEKIRAFVKAENPDILCVQEHNNTSKITYPYKYINLRSGNHPLGQAIYSKYKIINQGSIDFKGTYNNAIFVDIVKNLDTIRIYNIHLQSLNLEISKENLGQKSSEKLFSLLSYKFTKQQRQVDKIMAHKNKCPYPVVLSGDFNNTAYSWAYHQLKLAMTDSFIESGSGFGKTLSFKRIPMRIDFIFADKTFIFTEHTNYNIKYSDHTPIMATIGI